MALEFWHVKRCHARRSSAVVSAQRRFTIVISGESSANCCPVLTSIIAGRQPGHSLSKCSRDMGYRSFCVATTSVCWVTRSTR